MTEDATTIVIVNPRSAAGSTLRRFERERSQFQTMFPRLEVRLTERPRHATELVRQAIQADARRIISVGGDGTNHEVVNGFFDEQGQLIDPSAALGLVTSGTGGDFRRTFGWSTAVFDDVRRIQQAKPRSIDVGKLTYTTSSGTTETRFFLNISSFGVSGQIVDTVNRSSKAFGAKASFISGTVRTLMGYQPPRVRLSLDDAPEVERSVTTVAVANGQYFGGGMWIAPHAQVDDGWLDCVCVAGGGLGLWMQHGWKIYAGRHERVPAVEMRRVKRVRACPVGAEPVFVEADGELLGQLPATFEVLPAVLPFLG